jgi:hypothetical protein
MNTTSPITTRDLSDPFNAGAVGDLTEKQYAALETVARLSPGYHFEVARYNGSSSRATHVMVWAVGNTDHYVALVGADGAQYFDHSPATAQVARRVAHRVYRTSGAFTS